MVKIKKIFWQKIAGLGDLLLYFGDKICLIAFDKINDIEKAEWLKTYHSN